MTSILFYMFAILLIGSSLFVVLSRNPIYSVVMLVFAFANLAALYFLLEAYFIGILQILVYAGAIMVLFLFVVMLLNVGPDRPRPQWAAMDRWWFGGTVGVVGLTLLALVTRGMSPLSSSAADIDDGFGEIVPLATDLFTRYLLPFETAALLLTVALIGTVFLAKRRI